MRSKLSFDTIHEKRDRKCKRKAPKSRNFDVLHAFSVCQRSANIWFRNRIIIF
jgi:hypothetical protein